MQVISLIILVITLLIYGIFQYLFLKQYYDYFDALDQKEYSFKAFLPGCLGIVDTLKLTGAGRYQTLINQKIVMLYGSRYLTYFNRVHWAIKIFYLLLGILLTSFFCFFGKVEGLSLFVIPAAGIGFFLLADKTLDDRYKERKSKLERDFPDFMSKLVLLVNAGLNIRQAIERIAYEARKNTPLYQELQYVISDIQAGVSENEAYAGFAERCRIKQITNFVSIIRQNMRLGGNQMVFELRRMGTECWEMRKNNAKQLGETASSKLMLPLAIMFIAIVLICVAPVILELRSVF